MNKINTNKPNKEKKTKKHEQSKQTKQIETKKYYNRNIEDAKSTNVMRILIKNKGTLIFAADNK